MSRHSASDNSRLPGRLRRFRQTLSGRAAGFALLGLLFGMLFGTLPGTLFGAGAGAQQDTPPPASEQVDLSDPKALEQRGDLYMVRKFYPEAVGMYRKLTELQPRNPIYQNKLGIAYHQLQDFNSAKKAYQAAVKLNPKYAEAINNLAAVEYARKNYRAAILTYLKALELSHGDAVIYSNLGTAYFAYKKYDYAMTSYRYALMRDPEIFTRSGRSGSIVHQREDQDIKTLNFYMAKTYASMGDVENTLIYINKAWEAGFPELRKNLADKEFAFLATEPRFLDLLAQMDAEQQKKTN